MSVLPEESRRFREQLIDGLWSDSHSVYIDADRFIGVCPACGSPVGVVFHGHAARADVNCHGGCSEAAVVRAIRARARSAA